jgi:hypothetical protein
MPPFTKTGTVTERDAGVAWSQGITSALLNSHWMKFAGSVPVEIAVRIDMFFVIPIDFPPGVSLVQK